MASERVAYTNFARRERIAGISYCAELRANTSSQRRLDVIKKFRGFSQLWEARWRSLIFSRERSFATLEVELVTAIFGQ